MMQQGEKWFAVTPDGRLTPEKGRGAAPVFGDSWAETRRATTEPRCDSAPSTNSRTVQATGRFILVPGEEVTDRYRLAEIHINALNVESLIEPQHGDSASDHPEQPRRDHRARGELERSPQ